MHIDTSAQVLKTDFSELIMDSVYKNSKKIYKHNKCIFEYDMEDTFIVFIVDENNKDKAIEIKDVLRYTLIKEYLYLDIKNIIIQYIGKCFTITYILI
jgi:hypothetical protein